MLNVVIRVLVRLLIAFMGLSRRLAWLLLPALIAAMGYTLYYLDGRLYFDPDPMALADKDVRSLRAERDLRHAFPQVLDPLLIVIDAPNREIGLDTQARIVKAIKKSADYGPVYAPESMDVYAGRALLDLTPDQLEALTDQLAALQPLMSGLPKEPTLVHLLQRLDVLGKQGVGIPASAMDQMRVAIDGAVDRSTKDMAYVSWLDLWLDRRPEGVRLLIKVSPLQKAGPLSTAVLREKAQALQKLVGGASFSKDVFLRVTAEALVTAPPEDDLGRQISLLSAAIGLGLLILFLGLRSMRLAVACLFGLGLVGLGTLGLAVFLFGKLNLMSGAAVLIVSALGLHQAVNFVLAYRNGREAALNNDRSLVMAGLRVGGASILTMLVTMAAFVGFGLFGNRALLEFAVLGIAGSVLILTALSMALPVFLHILQIPEGPRGVSQGVSNKAYVLGLVFGFKNFLIFILIVVSLAGLASFPFIGFNGNPVNLYGKGGEFQVAFRDLLATPEQNPWSLDVVVKGENSALALATRLELNDQVDHVEWLGTMKPPEPGKNRKGLENLDYLLMGLPEVRIQAAKGASAALKKFKAANKGLEALARASSDPTVSTAAVALAESLGALEESLKTDLSGRRSLFKRVDDALFSGYGRSLQMLRAALDAAKSTQSAKKGRSATKTRTTRRSASRYKQKANTGDSGLPQAIQDMWMVRPDLYRLKVLPANPLLSDASMEAFVDSVKAEAPYAVGAPVRITRASKAVSKGISRGLVLGLVLTAIALLLFATRWVDAVVVLVTLSMLVALCLGLIWLLNKGLDYQSATVIPMVLVLGLASAIQIIFQLREVRPAMENALGSQIAQPQWVSSIALLVILSFATAALPMAGNYLVGLVAASLAAMMATMIFAVGMILTPRILVGS